MDILSAIRKLVGVTRASGLEYKPWIQPGNVGNDGGGSSLPHGTCTIAPGWTAITFKPAKLPNGQSDNCYLYGSLGDQSQANAFSYSFAFMFPGDLAACQAFEWELQQNFGNAIYNMAWQFRPGSGMFYFNYAASQWVGTGIPLVVVPGQPVSVKATFRRNDDGTVTHRMLAINGTEHTVGVKQSSVPQVAAPYLNYAIQLDGNASAATQTLLLSDVQVECWTEFDS